MMELTKRGSTLWALALCSTMAEMAEGAGAGADESPPGEGTTLRTSFRVRGSTRTTTVFRVATASARGDGGATVSAARMGEAACITKASKKQIYTLLFPKAIGMLDTIIS